MDNNSTVDHSHGDGSSNADLLSQLNEEEASQLAEELKHQLRTGILVSTESDDIQRMVAGLGDRRGLLRLTFAESLGSVGSSAVPALCNAMCHHTNVTVRRAAAKTLTLIADASALPHLLQALLNDEDPVVQGSAVGAMAAIGSEAVDGLLNILINPDSSQMQIGLASWGLSFVGARAPKALREAAQSEHAQIRSAAIAALGDQIQSLDDQEARNLLTLALNDSAEDVRAEAATLLGKLHDVDWAEPLLAPKLVEESIQVRKNAALSLMKLGDPKVIPLLEEVAQNETESSVITIFQLAIRQLKGAL